MSKLATSCREKLLSRARAGDPAAQEEVADDILLFGPAQDVPEAFFWLTLAAEQERASALRKSALIRLYGIGGIQPDVPRGVELLEQAAEQKDPEALFALGKLYEEGLGVPQDVPKALDLFLEAGAAGQSMAVMEYLRLDKPWENSPSSSASNQGA